MNLPKLRKRVSFRCTNSFATSRSRILSVLALCLCNKATLLKRYCFMLARNHVFTLLAMENDRSPVALVAGFTNRSLQITITSVFMCLLIGNTLNRFQNIGKAINLRILDQHLQNFELGKKISSSYIRQHNFLSCSPFVRIRLASSKRLSEETPYWNTLWN